MINPRLALLRLLLMKLSPAGTAEGELYWSSGTIGITVAAIHDGFRYGSRIFRIALLPSEGSLL